MPPTEFALKLSERKVRDNTSIMMTKWNLRYFGDLSLRHLTLAIITILNKTLSAIIMSPDDVCLAGSFFTWVCGLVSGFCLHILYWIWRLWRFAQKQRLRDSINLEIGQLSGDKRPQTETEIHQEAIQAATSSMNQRLTIMQYNANRSKDIAMAYFMRDPTVLKAGVIAIQEPWGNPYLETTHHPAKQTHQLLYPQSSETGGEWARVCMFVSKRIEGWTHVVHSKDCQELRLRKGQIELRIFNIYNPTDPPGDDERYSRG